MRDFFGLEDADIPPGLDEDELLGFYRARLKETCGLPYVANLAIPHPTHNRTWFHLVVGGHHHEVLNLFRNVERKVCGDEADEVRSGARGRVGGQEEMVFGQDRAFDARHERDLRRVRQLLQAREAGRREAAEEVGVSYRTVYRLLRSLEAVGLPVEQQREGRAVFWRLRRQDLLAWLSAPPDATWRPTRRHRAASR